jgi:cysteine desulfurase/selenocysteine lyase
VIGFGEALRFIEKYGRKEIAEYEKELLAYATAQVGNLPKVRLIGTAKEKASVLSFVIDGIHPHDIGTVLDTEGVAIRTGQHCAEPVMKHFGVEATARLSVSFYTTKEDIDHCVRALQKTLTLFG